MSSRVHLRDITPIHPLASPPAPLSTPMPFFFFLFTLATLSHTVYYSCTPSHIPHANPPHLSPSPTYTPPSTKREKTIQDVILPSDSFQRSDYTWFILLKIMSTGNHYFIQKFNHSLYPFNVRPVPMFLPCCIPHVCTYLSGFRQKIKNKGKSSKISL